MTRVLTALVILPLALAGVFYLSGLAFLFFLTVIVELAVWEYAAISARLAGGGVMRILLIMVPLAVLCLEYPGLSGEPVGAVHLIAFGTLVAAGSGVVALWSRRDLEQTVAAFGLLAFGTAYFAVPIAATVALRELGPWYVLLAALIVWVGDSAAFYVGTRWGRHKLAPVISPNKSWEGAVAGFVAALAATAAWSAWRLETVEIGLLAGGALTSVAAQLGDLVESSLKRRVGVKDSSTLLPGHGGMLDRLDSLLFAAPVLLLSLWALGWHLP